MSADASCINPKFGLLRTPLLKVQNCPKHHVPGGFSTVLMAEAQVGDFSLVISTFAPLTSRISQFWAE
jgi:hypothetical protein